MPDAYLSRPGNISPNIAFPDPNDRPAVSTDIAVLTLTLNGSWRWCSLTLTVNVNYRERS